MILFLLALLLPAHALAATLLTDPTTQKTWTTTQGETPTFAFIAHDDSGHAIDLTDGVCTSYVKGEVGGIVSIPYDQHMINVVQSGASRGKLTIYFSSANTSDMEALTYKDVVTKVVQGSSIIYLHGTNILTVLPNVPVQ